MNNNPRRILLVEPFDHSHRQFDTFFIRCMSTCGAVTLIAHKNYIDSVKVNNRINIPQKYSSRSSRLGSLFDLICIHRFVKKILHKEQYDIVIFLAYHTMSLSLFMPNAEQVFVFEHNNIDNACGSRLKLLFYKFLSKKIIHLTLSTLARDFVCNSLGRRAFFIRHPYYGEQVEDKTVPLSNTHKNIVRGRKIIFSPSGSTLQKFNSELKDFAICRVNDFFVIAKGEKKESGPSYSILPYFDDYENLMSKCDLVFIGMFFNYRVSGVAYEALSYEKPLISIDCPFARDLKSQYPNMVFIIDDISQIDQIEIDQKQLSKDAKRFLKEHSYHSIYSSMKAIVLSSKSDVYCLGDDHE